MWRQLSIFGAILLLITISFSGCVEEKAKPKLEISFDTESSEFPVQLIVTSVDSDRTYNWSEINISLVSQYTEPSYLTKEGDINIGSIIEIPDSIFDEVSKIDVRIRLSTSSILIWGDTVYSPITTPNISFTINESKIIVESINNVDYEWDISLTISNDTKTITDHPFNKNKLIEVGDTIDLYEYEIYGTVEVTLIYNPTGETIGNFTLDLTEPDPEIYLTVHNMTIDHLVNLAYFYIHSGKTTFGTKVINWEITPDLPDWLTVSPMNGNFSYGEYKVNLSFSSTGLEAGEYNHILKITSNYGNEELKITLIKVE